ncbi:MAG: lysophospholipid acyltransferase family protein [Chloroflexota bacterium]
MNAAGSAAKSAAKSVAKRGGRRRPAPDEVERGGPIRLWLSTIVMRVVVGVYLRLRVEGRDRLPDGPALLCFNHQSWIDPFVLIAALPAQPELLFFGPREADMRIGMKNRLIALSRRGVPFRPDKRGLVEVARRVDALFERGGRLAIAPEGRIHAGERVILPLDDGAAYFAARAGVPIVPIAILGVSWLRFGGTVRVRVGEAIPAPPGRATRDSVETLTVATRRALLELVADGLDREPPGPFGRWLTEVFQDWPEGSRPPIQDQQ